MLYILYDYKTYYSNVNDKCTANRIKSRKWDDN